MLQLQGRSNDDYWSSDFDPTKNCKQEHLIRKLQKEKDQNGVMIRCARVSGKSDEKERWEKCKKRLMDKLVNICEAFNIVEVRIDCKKCKVFKSFIYCRLEISYTVKIGVQQLAASKVKNVQRILKK